MDWEKNAKRIGTRPSARQLSIFEGSLAELLRFWCCQLRKMRKCRRISLFLTLSSSKIEDVSQNCFVFDGCPSNDVSDHDGSRLVFHDVFVMTRGEKLGYCLNDSGFPTAVIPWVKFLSCYISHDVVFRFSKLGACEQWLDQFVMERDMCHVVECKHL